MAEQIKDFIVDWENRMRLHAYNGTRIEQEMCINFAQLDIYKV